LSLIGEEEECFVFDDRAAQRRSELVALEVKARYSQLVIEVVVGVEGPVPNELERAAMDLIGTRLGDDTDDSAAVATVLRRVIAGQQSELGDGIGIGIEQVAVIQQVVVVAAIEQEGHGIGSSAGDAVTARAAVVVVALR